MSELELSSLRAAMHPSPDLTDNSGDSSTVQDRLLNANHIHANGNGVHHPHPYQQHKNPYPSYDLGAPRPRPVTGSGVVFRRKRKPCWCVLLVIVAAALMATGISLGVLFGVVIKSEEIADSRSGDSSHSSNPAKSNSSHTTPVVDWAPNGKDESEYKDHEHDEDYSEYDSREDFKTEAPRTPPGSTPRPPGSRRGGSPWGVSVRRFKAYWHPGDSRMMEVLLSNGTVLQAAGRKANNGTFLGLYSLSLTDGEGRTTRVRFMGARNLASVILPDGAVVSLDWSANNADVECKIFQIPPPRGAPGGGPGGMADYLSTPTSHLATLQLGVHSFLLRQISKTLSDASDSPGAFDDEPADSGNTQTFCAPRLPVKVTKCGGQYPYDGAFVQGEVTMETGPSLAMAALPWKRQDDDDACYSQFRAASPNFFIPLPGHIERTAARDIAARFWRSAARWWERVCAVVGTVLEVDLERHKVCANMAASAQTQLSHSALYGLVYDSCAALLSSLHLACRTLDDLTMHAASAAVASGGRASANSASMRGGGASRRPVQQELLQRVLANSTSLQEPATSLFQQVQVKTYAFCPSTQPLSSFEKALTLQSSAGGVSSQDITAEDMVHVNCPGQPEVTYFYLGHAAAIQPLDMVKHRLKVCAVCAFEKTFTVHVQRDHMCCNDTCVRESRCEDSISEARRGVGLRETHTFQQQNSVYCHEFLTAADTPTRPLPRSCLGTCQSNLEVRFQVKDSQQGGGLGVEGERVYLDQVLTCLEGYRSTCKSTFGH